VTVAVTAGFWLRFEGMPDQLSALYGDLLEGSYDCVDRVVLNAYFGRGQFGGGLRLWWRALCGSDENLDDAHLMRMAGRFSRRLRAWAKDNKTRSFTAHPARISTRWRNNIWLRRKQSQDCF
jgi:hypothetical protein